MATERRNFTDEEINKVWEKATKQPNNNPDVFRKDYAGAWIRRDDYGKRDKPYGWEIDHIRPASKGGDDVISNARPLHWKNNASRQDGRLTKVITSKGTKNILVETGEEFNPND